MSAVPTELPLSPLAADPAPVGLRLLPAPCSEPPYDDERPGGRPLPLRPAGLRSAPLRLVPAPVDPDEDAEPRTPTGLLPDARLFAHALVQRLLETLAGLRPVAQLQRHTSLEVYDTLAGMVASGRRTSGPRPDGRAVRSLHVQRRTEGVAEVCATVRRGDRYGAIALRLEGVNGGWRCTELALP